MNRDGKIGKSFYVFLEFKVFKINKMLKNYYILYAFVKHSKFSLLIKQLHNQKINRKKLDYVIHFRTIICLWITFFFNFLKKMISIF